MQTATQVDTVNVHYVGQLEDGTIFDSSENREPLQFTLGSNQVIPGFDEGVRDMAIDDKKKITIPCKDAYGEYSNELIHELDRSQIPPDLDLEIGLQLQMMTNDNQPLVVTVKEINDKKVTIDANHHLAGKTLIFEITLVEII